MSLWRFGLLAVTAHAQCVTKQLISAGDGVTFPQPGDTVSMHYTGTLASTGAKFDSSRDRGKEFSTKIGVGQVIQGWDEGVPQMSLGEHAILRISAACGYGAQGSPPVIPPNADLVFDVELNGLNGRRAGASMAPPSFLPAAPPAFGNAMTTSFSAPAPATAVAPPAALPRCIASSCGHAISFDTTGAGRPLCLCNPLCQEWANTPGILPCCPGLQEVCLDPYRSPSPRPATASASVSAAAMSSPMSTPMSTPLSAPMNTMPVAPPANVLPTCRTNSCGKGMASGINSMTAVCACDVSCLAPGSTLPCCQSFREVCLAPSAAAAATAPPTFSTPVSQQLNIQASATLVAQSSAPVQPVTAARSASSSQSAACMLGKTMWAEQPACDKKRWAIQNGKCKKVCPAIDAQSGIKYYPTGQPGKDACAAAVALCK